MEITGKGIQVDGKVEKQLEVDISDCIEIPLFDMTGEQQQKREKFNRSKVKRQTQKQIDEELEDWFR